MICLLKVRLCLDIGSSTGGFTDCGLQNGVKHAYALDVGSNQLAWKIRSDRRVTVWKKQISGMRLQLILVEGLPILRQLMFLLFH